MNAELIWMTWQAAGTHVPLAVCEALAYLAWYYAEANVKIKDGQPNNSGDVSLYTLAGPSENHPDADVVIYHYAPMAINDDIIDRMRHWVRHVDARIDHWTEDVIRMCDDPETRAWAGLPGPVTGGE